MDDSITDNKGVICMEMDLMLFMGVILLLILFVVVSVVVVTAGIASGELIGDSSEDDN